MNTIAKILQKYPLMVLDGAFGTEVSRRGFDVNDELWSAKALFERPDLVKAVHRDYFLAGADVSSSASYQASVEGFMKRGFSRSEARELIALAVRLVREASDEVWQGANKGSRIRPLVAASIGPYGAYLADGSEYTGKYSLSRSELRDFHEERLAVLQTAEPDIFAGETLPLLEEALAIVDNLVKYDDAVAWISFSCKDNKHIAGGESIRDCAKALDKIKQVVAIGINCTAPEYVTNLIGEVRQGTAKPVVIYPNTGETYDPVTKTWSGAPQPYSQFVAEWYRAGASLIGGCCGTNPEHIKSIAEFRKKLMD